MCLPPHDHTIWDRIHWCGVIIKVVRTSYRKERTRGKEDQRGWKSPVSELLFLFALLLFLFCILCFFFPQQGGYWLCRRAVRRASPKPSDGGICVVERWITNLSSTAPPTTIILSSTRTLGKVYLEE